MQLIQVRINGYKHLKNTCVNFNNQSGKELFHDGLPIRFFIGLNGSGKSVFLEALCILFSRLVQDELPGFDFTLVYNIWREQNYRVEVTNGAEHLQIHVLREDGREMTPDSFAEHRYLLPDYILTCASGVNNNFYDIMVRSPRVSLQSDLFDLSLLGQSRYDEAEREEKIRDVLLSLRCLEENPISMFIDEKNAVLALAAFLAVLPGGLDDPDAGEQLRCRERLLSMLADQPCPVSLSFTLDEKRAGELEEEIEQFGTVFGEYSENPGAKRKPGREWGRQAERRAGWTTQRAYQDETIDVENAHGDRVITWLFEPCGEGNVRCVRKLTEDYKNPLEFLSRLILARNRGLLKECHISFRLRGTEDILEENAFSEGEYMFLVRMGLLVMGRQRRGSSQCLYLYDEPDVYLNERWNIDFISDVQKIFEDSGVRHEIVIATHSSLMLTDAFPEQLYYFRQKEGGVSCTNIRASTFGGSRNEIMQALFGTEHSVGSYSYRKVKKLLEEEEDIGKLEACLESVGSGYLRLRLLDKIQLLKKR